MFTSTPVPTRAKPKFSSASGSNLPQKIKDAFRTTEASNLSAGLNKKWAWVSTKNTILLWNHGKDQANSHAPLVFRLPPSRSDATIEWSCFVISAGRTQVDSLLAISSEGTVVWFPTLVPENRFDTTTVDLQVRYAQMLISFSLSFGKPAHPAAKRSNHCPLLCDWGSRRHRNQPGPYTPGDSPFQENDRRFRQSIGGQAEQRTTGWLEHLQPILGQYHCEPHQSLPPSPERAGLRPHSLVSRL